MDKIQDAINHLGWVRASNNEKVIRALLEIGIKPENCFMDEKDNFVIPFSEIQRKNNLLIIESKDDLNMVARGRLFDSLILKERKFENYGELMDFLRDMMTHVAVRFNNG